MPPYSDQSPSLWVLCVSTLQCSSLNPKISWNWPSSGIFESLVWWLRLLSCLRKPLKDLQCNSRYTSWVGPLLNLIKFHFYWLIGQLYYFCFNIFELIPTLSLVWIIGSIMSFLSTSGEALSDSFCEHSQDSFSSSVLHYSIQWISLQMLQLPGVTIQVCVCLLLSEIIHSLFISSPWMHACMQQQPVKSGQVKSNQVTSDKR